MQTEQVEEIRRLRIVSPRHFGGEVGRIGLIVPLVFGIIVMQGCLTPRVRTRMLNQASSLPTVYYQEVLNNLAMIEADPAGMPYFSDPQTARTRVQQSTNVSYGLNWDLISTAPTGVLTLFSRYLLDRQGATLAGGQSDTGEWTALTANDPDKLFTMRAAYRHASGKSNAEDEEILSEFYYRHFQITDQALARLRENRPEVYEKIGAKLAKLKDIEYLTVESFEARLKSDDILGKDDTDRYRRPILRYSRMEHEPNEFVSDADTHHLLYVSGLKPGWFGVGPKGDVPKNAAYVGQYGKTFVWVMPDHVESLTRMTLAILDIHTFKSERIGGSRVQPGILPR